MTNTDPTPTTPTPELTREEEAARAKREERRGWLALIGFFGAGGLLIVLAAIVT